MKNPKFLLSSVIALIAVFVVVFFVVKNAPNDEISLSTSTFEDSSYEDSFMRTFKNSSNNEVSSRDEELIENINNEADIRLMRR